MRVTTIQTNLNESGRTGLSAEPRSVAARAGYTGFAARSTQRQAFPRPQMPLGAERRLINSQDQAL